MLRPIRVLSILLILSLVVAMASAQAPSCPGFNSGHNVSLACEIPTALRNTPSVQGQSLSSLSPTLAAQLSQLPNATVISGTGLTISAHGVPTLSTESLGTILTQRGETLGRHKFFVSFSYQRFGFDSIDGIPLKHLDTVNEIDFSSAKVFAQNNNRVDLHVDQFAALGSFGLTSRVDISVMVPFSKVTLKTSSSGTEFTVSGNQTVPLVGQNVFLAGSATGLGDVSVNLKANIVKLEKTKMAVGGEVRFPTGDENNYLGTGAYGFKPYIVLSHSGRITPSINLGYQWNSSSPLFVDPKTGAQLNLPSAFLYSGGVDYRVVKRLTLTAEFLGQEVINGPRLASSPQTIPGKGTFPSVVTLTQTYAMDNAGVGFKANPIKGLLISANALFKLDDGGLRSKVVPLVGISYRF